MTQMNADGKRVFRRLPFHPTGERALFHKPLVPFGLVCVHLRHLRFSGSITQAPEKRFDLRADAAELLLVRRREFFKHAVATGREFEKNLPPV